LNVTYKLKVATCKPIKVLFLVYYSIKVFKSTSGFDFQAE